MKKTKLILSCLFAFIGISVNAYAHDDATLDSMKSPHGGIVRMAGQYHFELVNQPKEKSIFVYVTDHANKEISVASLKGTMMVMAEGTRVNLTLKPHPKLKNVFIVGGNFDPSQSHISVTIDGQTARFNPKK